MFSIVKKKKKMRVCYDNFTTTERKKGYNKFMIPSITSFFSIKFDNMFTLNRKCAVDNKGLLLHTFLYKSV